MKIRKGSAVDMLLRGLSWSENIGKPNRYVIPETFSEKLLAGLSFSFDSKKDIFVRRKIDPTFALEIGRLWDKAHRNMRLGRLVTAEKALIQILEMDPTNAAAYNRLGIIKAKQKRFSESIFMFKQAVRLEKSAAATHNLALAYYEVKDYEKSEYFFRKSIRLDRSLAARHIALAKVLEKQGKETQMFKELVRAVELEPSRDAFKVLESAYRNRNMLEEANLVKNELRRESIGQSVTDKPAAQYRISERSDRVGQLLLSYE